MAGKLSILLLLLLGTKAYSQHLIGLTKDEVLQKMQETSFVPDNTSSNATFNYLKFVDRFEEKTLLIFMSKENVCTSTKLMGDFSTYRSTVQEFNKKYKKISSTEWNYQFDGKTYKVTVKKEDWFYSVITTKNF